MPSDLPTSFGGSGRLFCIHFLLGGCCKGDLLAFLLDKECPCNGRNLFWDWTVFNMLSHLLDEFGHELDRGANLLYVEVVVVDLDLVSVDGVLRDGNKILKILVKCCHKNKRQCGSQDGTIWSRILRKISHKRKMI